MSLLEFRQFFCAKKEAVYLEQAWGQFPKRVREAQASAGIVRQIWDKVNTNIRTSTDSKQFKRWFGDSVVTDRRLHMNNTEWTFINDNPVVVDFTGCKYVCDIHNAIRKAFGFPAYYGKNWDAFWDCITDFFLGYGSWGVELRGYDSLSEEFQEYLQPMFDMFKEVEQTYPDIVVTVTISS